MALRLSLKAEKADPLPVQADKTVRLQRTQMSGKPVAGAGNLEPMLQNVRQGSTAAHSFAER